MYLFSPKWYKPSLNDNNSTLYVGQMCTDWSHPEQKKYPMSLYRWKRIQFELTLAEFEEMSKNDWFIGTGKRDGDSPFTLLPLRLQNMLAVIPGIQKGKDQNIQNIESSGFSLSGPCSVGYLVKLTGAPSPCVNILPQTDYRDAPGQPSPWNTVTFSEAPSTPCLVQPALASMLPFFHLIRYTYRGSATEKPTMLM